MVENSSVEEDEAIKEDLSALEQFKLTNYKYILANDVHHR